MFRKLKASEIDVRVQQCTVKGAILLLYKDARVDQVILDETVGAMNWERKHSRDNMNCTVSIWCKEKLMWVSKEDTGTESNTEKEKGLASDSFKRACFNWGIGRELYSSPFIWVKADQIEIEQGNNNKYQTRTKFSISEIHYTDNEISGLVISTDKGKEVYRWGQFPNTTKPQPPQQKVPTKKSAPKLITVDESLELITLCARKGSDLTKLMAHYHIDKLENMTSEQFADAKAKLEAKPDVE